MIHVAELDDRCDTHRHGHCTILRNREPLMIGFPHRLRPGDHVSFLITEAHPSPQETIHFENQMDFQTLIHDVLLHSAPRQYLTIFLHGFRSVMFGTRSYGAHRQRIEDLDVFRGDIMSIWNDEAFDRVHVFHAHPQEVRRDRDGAIMMHFIVAFAPTLNPLILIQRSNGMADMDFMVLDPPQPASLTLIVHMIPWEMRPIRGFWGLQQLHPTNPLHLMDGMHLRLVEDDISDTGGTDDIVEGQSLLQMQTTLWHANDRLHGRSVGHNGFSQLRPPGNGHAKSVTFGQECYFVDEEKDSFGYYDQNPFVLNMTEFLKQDPFDDNYNCCVADFRRAIGIQMPQTPADFTEDFWECCKTASFSNDFLAHFCLFQAEEDDLEQNIKIEDNPIDLCSDVEVWGGPRIQLELEKLVPQTMTSTMLPIGLEPIPKFLKQPWDLHRQEQHLRTALPDSLDLHQTTTDWISAQPRQLPQQGTGVLCIYTDGSFFPAKEVAAWAIAICWAPHLAAEPGEMQLLDWYASMVVTSETSHDFVGAQWHDATNAETSALIWASLFAMAHREYDQVIFCYDCYGVGMAGMGNYNYTMKYPAVKNLRHLQQAVESIWGISNVPARHVRGHVGDPVNELVNTLAQEQARSWLVEKCPNLDIGALVRDSILLSKLWLLLDPKLATDQWPQQEGQQFIVPDRRTLLPLPDGTDWTFGYGAKPSSNGTEVCYNMNLKIMSHNVQSLLGKIQYYRAQAHASSFNVIGLQETASRSTQVTKADGFLRLAVAADKGHGGIELWLSTMVPIAWIANKPVFWDLNNVLILHQDSNLLIAKVKVAGLGTFVLTVGHAPHSGHTWEQNKTWWTKLSLHLSKNNTPCHHILMLDANAQLGSIPSPAIGTYAQSEEDENGELLRGLMDKLDAWIPSTFWHMGDPCTWYSPAAKTRQGRRIDYICVSHSLAPLYAESWTATTMDTGHKNIDHSAIALLLRGHLQGHQLRHRAQPGIDWQQVRKTTDESIWRTIFHELPISPWSHDTHRHWHDAQRSLTDVLQQFFPKQGRCPKRHYISEASWTLRRTRNFHKEIWRSGLKALETFLLQRGFHTWRDAEHIDTTGVDFNITSLLIGLRTIHAGPKIHALSTALKKQIKMDKNQFIATVAQQAAEDPSNIYKTLKKAGVNSQRSRRTNPLPGLLKANGEPCVNKEELTNEWMQYFASIEGGHRVHPQGLLQMCAVEEIQQNRCQLRTWNEIPSLYELENAFRKCRPHKAAGTDQIVPEICRRAAKWFARWTYPLFAKMVTYRAEPIAHKGGVLHSVWKRRGPMNDPSSFRGILVSSQVAKVFHSTFRTKAISAFQNAADPLQYGGLPGRRSLKQLSHAVYNRAFATNRSSLRLSSSWTSRAHTIDFLESLASTHA